MNMRSLPLWMALLALLGASGLADDRLVSVDPKTRIITVDSAGVLKLYRIGASAQITVNGAPSGLPQLLPGQSVAIKSVEPNTATKIAASGLGRTAPAPAQPLALRSVTVQMRVDGSDRIFYQDGKLWIEHRDAKRPTDIVVNGVEWTPVWSDNNKAEPFTAFSVPLAPIGQGKVSVKQLMGRSKIKAESSPDAPGLAVIDDGKSGADDYAFQFSW